MKAVKVLKKKKVGSANAPLLERVLGMSAKSGNGVSTNAITGDIAYTAAGVIVLYNPTTNKQLSRLINSNCRTFACVAFSPDGKLLAAGEGTCKGPKIFVWEYAPPTLTLLKQLEGHRFGVDRLVFSPSGELLVTVGVEHDQGLFLWKWRQEQRLTANKLSKKVNSLAFDPAGRFFVTCGQKSLLFWLFDEGGKPVVTPASEQAEVKCIACKGASLGEMREKTFTGVTVNEVGVFAVTEDGKLCTFSKEREMEKWMDLQVAAAATIQVRGRHIYCGCSDGLIRCFDAMTLEHLVTLPRPPPLGAANITTDRQRQPQIGPPQFADTTALDLLGASLLLALYSDRTLFIWDMRKMDNIIAARALLNHSGAINDLKILPSSTPDMTEFATASSDKTVRRWYLTHSHKCEGPAVRNIFSKDLSRIIYITKSFEHFKSHKPEQPSEGSIRCISISADSRLLASGDSVGTMRVHDLATYREIWALDAHENEVTGVDFTGKSPAEARGSMSEQLLASCSRDRIIHITKGERAEAVLSLEDHSSSITDIKFVKIGDTERLISCSTDKTLLFRMIRPSGNEVRCDVYQKCVQKSRKFYCLEVHPIHKELITGEDKVMRVWDLDTGKAYESRDMSDPDPASKADAYTRVCLDATGILVAAASLDKQVRIFDYYSGRLGAKMSVGETVNALAFTPGGEKLLMATNDGCVFVWGLPKELTQMIRNRLSSVRASRAEPTDAQEPAKEEAKEAQPPKRMHDSLMPLWAKGSVLPPEPPKTAPLESKPTKEDQPIPGKWGKNTPMEFGLEEADSPVDSDPPPPRAVLKALEEVESDEEKPEEVESKPITEVSPPPSTDHLFNITRSIVRLPKSEEEQVTEAAYEPEADEEEVEEIIETKADVPVLNPLRQSLTASFLRKRQAELPIYHNLEIPQADEPPRALLDLKKKKKTEDVSGLISEAVQGLGPVLKLDRREKKKGWGRADSETGESEGKEPEDPKAKLGKSKTKLALCDLIPEESKAKAEAPKVEAPAMPRSEPFAPAPAKPEADIKPPPAKADSRFNSPSVLPDQSLGSISETMGSVSSSQFFATTQSRSNRQLYAQSFKELKQSLRDVNAFFSKVDRNDVEYSTSLQESSEDIEEIHRLIGSIGGALGRPQNSEADLLERFSGKLVEKVLEKLGSLKKD